MKKQHVSRMTVIQYRNLEFGDNDPYLYELIDGELVKKKAPNPTHQRLSRKLAIALDRHVTEKQLGEIFYSPINVFLDDFNSPQPDLVFVPTANQSIITDNGIEGIPSLIVEIISPTSIVRDRVIKKELYERLGVVEYWLVDPANKEIEIYILEENRYQIFSAASPLEGELKSNLLEGFLLDMKQLFE